MSTDLALTRPDPTMNEDSLRLMMAAAQRYVQSGLLPAEINTAQKALVVMTAGREMGVPATYALRNIHVVKGKPVCSAELLLALVRRTYGPSAMRVAKTSNTACTVQYREQGWDGVSEYTFSIEDAKQAGVTNGNQWKSYPAAMLRARCVSAVARFAFPEAIAGLYTPEEMGAAVSVDADGEVQYVDGEVVGTPPSDVQDGIPYCDAAYFNKAWHAEVKGTRFEQDEIRHKWMSFFTKGSYNSLADFLKGATTVEATEMIAGIKRSIEAEARKALIQELEAAVKHANAYGEDGGAFEIPDNVADLSDDEIQGMIDAATAVIEAADHSASNVQPTSPRHSRDFPSDATADQSKGTTSHTARAL